VGEGSNPGAIGLGPTHFPNPILGEWVEKLLSCAKLEASVLQEGM